MDTKSFKQKMLFPSLFIKKAPWITAFPTINIFPRTPFQFNEKFNAIIKLSLCFQPVQYFWSYRNLSIDLQIANQLTDFYMTGTLWWANIYLFKVNNRNTGKRCDIRSKLTIKIPEQCHRRHSSVFVVNFEYISHPFLVFLLWTSKL